MPDLATRLEDLLMQKHRSMRYADAKNLVGESRRSLHMSRIEPWNAPLLAECEQRWQITMQIADTDEIALMMGATTECSNSNNERNEKGEGMTTRKDSIKPGNDKPITETTSTTEPEDSDESFAKEVKPESTCVAPAFNDEEIPDLEKEHNHNAHNEENEENEDFSQVTDHSQCFTTAIEAGVSQAAINAAIAEAEKAEADDMAFVAKIDATTTQEGTKKGAKTSVALVEATTAAANLEQPGKDERRHTKHPTLEKKITMEDHITIDTAENSELSGIPTIIFVRKDGKCEVPANEPLGESYNIPLALLLANAKKSRMRKFREKFVRRMQRWGLVRRDTTTRLLESDYEVYVQTLVDL